MAHFHDICEVEGISVMGHAQSTIGNAAAYGWTTQYLGASAGRTANALETNITTIANNLAALVYDLKMYGILQ